MSLGSTLIKNCPSIQDGESEIQHYVNEFIYYFLYCLGRTALTLGGEKIEKAILSSVIDYVVQMLVMDAKGKYRESLKNFYFEGIFKARKYYLSHDDTSDNLYAAELYLRRYGAERIAKSGAGEAYELASGLLNVVPEIIKLDEYVLKIAEQNDR